MANSGEDGPRPAAIGMPSVEELFRNTPVQTLDDLACPGIFDTDREVDEFIEHVHASRRADLA